MQCETSPRVGYIVKRYPRYSETFIVNEVLAHERAGWDLSIFALRPPCDHHFQNQISKVRAPVTYLPSESVKGRHLWEAIRAALGRFENAATTLFSADPGEVQEVYQAVTLADHIQAAGIEHLHAHFATSAAAVARPGCAICWYSLYPDRAREGHLPRRS